MRYKQIVLGLSAALLLAACEQTAITSGDIPATNIPEGIQLVEDRTSAQSGMFIPYRKYRLDNGLTVVLHQDHSDPLVHVDVTYHVGSSREEPGKSGFAHFFEHMMFQGSENVADEQHMQMITEAGGTMNGTTNNDRTNYYQTVPANQLEKVLWMEADRMGFLLDAVTQEKFEIQRETVKNERAQRVDNQPYGLRYEKVSEALYPVNHPYSWPVIGYIDDLNRVNVNDLKAFFQRWYGPNNAVLTIGGAIDEQKTLAWIKRYFGTIPEGEKVKRLPKVPVTLDEDRYLTIEDDVHLPLLQITFPTVHLRHEDEAPLDVLSDILGGGKTSLFYKNLVKDGFAVHAGMGHPCRELACQFELVSLPNPQKLQRLADLEMIMRNTLNEFEQRGVSADDLARTKATIRSGTVFGLQSVSGKVSTLASNQINAGKPDKVQFDLDRYDAVTAEDVMRVYRKYIKGNASVTLSIVPNGQLAIQAKAPNFVLPPRTITPASGEFINNAATPKDDFDRSQMPVQGPNPAIVVPEYWQKNLKNGIPLMAHDSDETPTVSLVLSLEGGPLLDPLEKAGLARLTAQMMQETTKNFSNEAMANALAKLGSRISISAAGRFTTIGVSSLEENFAETMRLLEEKMFNPAFKAEDFGRLQQRTLQSIQQAKKNPENTASKALIKVLYGDNNRVSLPDVGTVASVSNITLQDVKAFYKRYYNAAMASIIVVGNIDQSTLEKELMVLGDWAAEPYEIPPYKPFPVFDEPALYVVNDAQAAQSIVNFVMPFLPYDADGEHFKSKLMNFPLGGMFNSRINLNLREDKGYTYGARSSFVGGKTLGRFTAGGAINKEHTVAALNEFVAEINGFRRTGMTEQELSTMRSAYTQGDALQYETPGSKARFLRHMSVYGLSSDYTERQNSIIKHIRLEELNQLATKHLDINAMQLVLVADMQTLGYEIRAWAQRHNRKVIELSL